MIDGIVKTPALVGSILHGITRNSVLAILKDQNIPFEECRISMEDITNAAKEGRLQEAFGSGTAAVISPVGLFNYRGSDIVVNNNQMGSITKFLYERLTGIQNGREADKFGWIEKVN